MCPEEYKCAHIVMLQHSVTTHSWYDCTLIQVSYLHVEEVYLDYPICYDRCSMSCLHARGISDLPMGNGRGLQHVSGNMLMMYENCVFWRSERQAVIAGDTTEAELIAMSSAANELMWLKQLCTDLSMSVYMAALWGDNKSANLLATNPVSSDRSKHIRVRHLRVRDAVEAEEMRLTGYVQSLCWQTD